MKKIVLTAVVFCICTFVPAEYVYKVEKVGNDLYKLSYATEMTEANKRSNKIKKVIVETKTIERTENQIRESNENAIRAKKQIDQLVIDLKFVIKELKKLKK